MVAQCCRPEPLIRVQYIWWPFIHRSTHLQRLPTISEPSAVPWPEKVIVVVSVTSATKLSCLKREPVIIQPQTTGCYNSTYRYEIVLNYSNSITILMAPAQVSCVYYIPSTLLLLIDTTHQPLPHPHRNPYCSTCPMPQPHHLAHFPYVKIRVNSTQLCLQPYPTFPSVNSA